MNGVDHAAKRIDELVGWANGNRLSSGDYNVLVVILRQLYATAWADAEKALQDA